MFNIPTLEDDMKARGYRLMSEAEVRAAQEHAESALALSSADFDEADLLDMAEDHGTVVDTNVNDGTMGFVSFSIEGFSDFCRELIEQVRQYNEVEPPAVITTHMDYIMALGAFSPLSRTLRATYQGREWPKDDKYVQAFDALFTAILKFERCHPHFTGPATQIAGLLRLSDKDYSESDQ